MIFDGLLLYQVLLFQAQKVSLFAVVCVRVWLEAICVLAYDSGRVSPLRFIKLQAKRSMAILQCYTRLFELLTVWFESCWIAKKWEDQPLHIEDLPTKLNYFTNFTWRGYAIGININGIDYIYLLNFSCVCNSCLLYLSIVLPIHSSFCIQMYCSVNLSIHP